MYTLIAFATNWGSKFGGINSFNTDFLKAFGAAYLDAQVICIVASASQEEIDKVWQDSHVRIMPLPCLPNSKFFTEAEATAGIEQLTKSNIRFNPENTIWLGHDCITGAASIAAAKAAGGRSALIHHMSYDHYEAYAESSQVAHEKNQIQSRLFRQADLVLAVGPLLRNAIQDMLRDSKPVHMLIPGLAEISPKRTPNTFTAFISGRFSDDTARLKQHHLGVAAFAEAHKEARDKKMPDGLVNKPKLVMRGVEFEANPTNSLLPPLADGETELNLFAEKYAESVITLHVLPFTEDRETLYDELSGASVALMPSWHEGFGLVAWEAIAAGVPLIISKDSGVYKFLKEVHPGTETGFIYPIDVHGTATHPFFRDVDKQAVITAIMDIANKPEAARKKASTLRNIIKEYTWPDCVEKTVEFFGWPLHKGSIPLAATVVIPAAPAIPVQSIPTPSSPLSMPKKQWQATSGLANSQLLRAEEEIVPFDPARQPEIDTLNAWLDDKIWPTAVRLITGAGGLGKTRLALELCRKRVGLGWDAGFLDATLDASEMAPSWKIMLAIGKPLLIVIDYAETRQDVLLALIKAMKNPASHPVRLLLLARDGGEWWDNLPSKDTQCQPLLSGYATTGPHRLPALHMEENDRRKAFQLALDAFALALGTTTPKIDPELAGEHFGRPLYLQMAALIALHGERPITAEGLTTALLHHERRYWRRLLKDFRGGEPERDAHQLLALTTLAGGFVTPREAKQYWAEAFEETPADFNVLFRTLMPLYPGKQGLQAVRPDILGEALVSQALLSPEVVNLLDAVLSSNAGQAVRRNALTVLARLSGQRQDLHETLIDALAKHFAHCYKEILEISIETPGDLPALAEAAFARLPQAVKYQVASLLAKMLIEESVQLAELSCAVTKCLLEKSKAKLSKNPGKVGYISDHATALRNYAVDLARVGRNERALVYALEGVDLLEGLNRRSNHQFEPEYAMSLNNYANHLSDAGRNEEALKHAKDSLDIRQRLAEKNPDRYEPNLATSLSNYANWLSDAGQNEEALKHGKHALDIRQRLAGKNPDRYEPGFATSLSNYANHLSDAGQNEEALKHGKHALDIHKRLAGKNPDRYEPGFATSLNNYANHLSDAGQNEEALKHAKESLDIHKRLAEKNSDRYEPEYAMSLNNYANHLSDAGQNEEALKHAKEALEIRQRLAVKNTKRFSEDLFVNNCSALFISWLSGLPAKSSELANLNIIPPSVSPHRRSRLLFFAAFIQACYATDQAVRAEVFKNALSIYDVFLPTIKNNTRGYWLCVSAWCAKYVPTAVAGIDWRADWNKYATQRQGRLPHWMAELARRMEFQLPS